MIFPVATQTFLVACIVIDFPDKTFISNNIVDKINPATDYNCHNKPFCLHCQVVYRPNDCIERVVNTDVTTPKPCLKFLRLAPAFLFHLLCSELLTMHALL